MAREELDQLEVLGAEVGCLAQALDGQQPADSIARAERSDDPRPAKPTGRDMVRCLPTFRVSLHQHRLAG
jgi:hypothetical protein